MKKRYCNAYAVIGLGFGDEGKGVTVNSLCKDLEKPLVVRYSGGQQAGHTVTMPDGTSHVFSNFGSASFKDIPTYWSHFCTFDPVGVMNEFAVLKSKGVNPRIYIDNRSPVTTPVEKFTNKIQNEYNNHGSCGVGVNATYRREDRLQSLLAGDLRHNSVFKLKYAYVCSQSKHSGYTGDGQQEKFFKACQFLLDHPKNFIFVDSIPLGFRNIVFEGSQGLLLDQNIGFFPHVTPSNTGTKNILAMGYYPHLLLITRAFQTRHGNGPMTNVDLPHNIKDNPKETNVHNEYQGFFRKSLLDLDLLKYGMERDEYIRNALTKELVVTCLDLVKDEYRYTANGKIVAHIDEKSFLKGIANFLGIGVVHAIDSPEGIYETINFDGET